MDKNLGIEEVTEPVDQHEEVIIDNGLRRGLEGRHIGLISPASIIGASCFYWFGYALYLSGPSGALIKFGIIGTYSPPSWEDGDADNLIRFMIWALMQSIGEVTTMFPIAGGFIEVSEFRVQ